MSFDVKYDDRLQKIREAAAAAIRQSDQLRSTAPRPRETLDAEVARIAQEKLQPYGCDLTGKKVVVTGGKHNATGNSIATTQWGSANLALAPHNGAEILLVIRLGDARTSRLTLKDFWNKNAPDW